MDKDIVKGFNHDITLSERKNILITGVKKIENFDNEQFLLETIMGFMIIKGEDLSLIKLDINWSILKVITLLLMLLSSIAIFFGIFLLAASYCFLTVQGLEVRNVFTDGGKNVAQYPIGIFNKYFVKIFTYIIPYAFVNYYPLLYFIDKSKNIFYYTSLFKTLD